MGRRCFYWCPNCGRHKVSFDKHKRDIPIEIQKSWSCSECKGVFSRLELIRDNPRLATRKIVKKGKCKVIKYKFTNQ
jgi:rubredoxin